MENWPVVAVMQLSVSLPIQVTFHDERFIKIMFAGQINVTSRFNI